MALRSHEELSLATIFTRALRSLLALTSGEERRAWPSASDIRATTPPDARELTPCSTMRVQAERTSTRDTADIRRIAAAGLRQHPVVADQLNAPEREGIKELPPGGGFAKQHPAEDG